MIRVLIAEGATMVRDALAVMLDLEDDIEVVGQVGPSDEIVPAVLACQPDVAVLDVGPEIDGLDAAERLRAELACCRVLILTGLCKPNTVRRALAADVAGYLLKNAPGAELAQAVRKVADRGQAFDPAVALTVLGDKPNPLTARETEVLQLTAKGEGPREIAARLRLSIGTVRNYLTAVVTKLHARNRVDALRIAQENGWLN